MMILDVFDKNFTRIAQIPSYSYAAYAVENNDSGSFELRLALNSTASLIQSSGKYILFEKDVLGIIEYFESSSETESTDELTIKGYLINSILEYRCVPKTVSITGTSSQIARKVVYDNCVDPEDVNRRLPIVLSEDSEYNPSDDSHTVQVTGNSVGETTKNVLSPRDMSYKVVPILSSTAIQNLEFRVIKNVDRTKDNLEGNSPVVFSTELKNILSGHYTYNSTDYKNIAYVAGEGEGQQRTIIEVGSSELSGVDRREMYVDARDLQSTDESGTTLTQEEYEEALNGRGKERLSEHPESVAYEATIQLRNTQYVYGSSFLEGDLVTIQDHKLGIQIDAKITRVQFTSYGEIDLIDVTFGEYRYSTIKKLQRKGVL